MSDYQEENIYGPDKSASQEGSSSKPTGLHKEAAPTARRIGLPPLEDTRLFGSQRLGARAEPVNWHVSKDDRMDAGAAAERIKSVEKAFGVDGAKDAEKEAFWEAVFFYHTVNSGSVAQPGRSMITIGHGGGATSYSFDLVMNVLGVDARRFFRACADEVRAVNKKVLANAGTRDIQSRERFEWLVQVASDRGLSRYPDLAHDSADACWGLNPAERAALANSKLAVLSRTDNFVDTTSSNARMRTAAPTVTTNPAIGRGAYE